MDIKVRALTESDDLSEIDKESNSALCTMLDCEDCVYGAFIGDKIIGYLSLGYADVLHEMENYPGYNYDCLLLSDVYVLEKYRHLGFGSKMIKEAIHIKPESKDNIVFLTLLDLDLKNFYNKIGFQNTHIDYIMALNVV